MAARAIPQAMEARQVEALPDGAGWQYEPKWDGFRCLARRDGASVELQGRSGKSLARYFPEMVAALEALAPRRFLLDGELVIPVGNGLSFDALQQRLHPASSRVQRLAAETPSLLVAFDLLEDADGTDLRGRDLAVRRAALERFFAGLGERGPLRLSPATRKRAEAVRWLERAGGGTSDATLDGVVAKRLDQTYRAGERAMFKIKHLRSADCVVGGFRYASATSEDNGSGGRRQVASLLLGLHDADGLLHHVGFTSALAGIDRAALTRRLEAMAGGGFTGDAPGGPSRWSTERSAEWQPVQPRLVVEVQYDHVTGRRFRHGTSFLRWRPDKAPRDCTFDQLETEARPSRLAALLEGRVPSAVKKAAPKVGARKKPVAKKKIAKNPATGTGTSRTPVAKARMAKSPISKRPISKKKVAKTPVAKKRIAKKRIAKKAAAPRRRKR